MTLLRWRDALSAGQRKLRERRQMEPETARLECEMMLSHILGCRRYQLYTRGDEPLAPDRLLAFRGMLERRLKGEPVQYILGGREFMGLDFHVDARALIPRWETEVLVELILDYRQKRPGPANILDLGTGSGAIAVSLAVYLPDSLITAVDIREEVLPVARENAERNGVADRIVFLRGDMFSALDAVGYGKAFDVIVSNPPYIPTGAIGDLMPEVRDYEPRAALDGGEDGLEYYRRIAEGAHLYLRQNGLVAVEMGVDQSAPVREFFLETGRYTPVEVRKDLAGIDRVAAFRKR